MARLIDADALLANQPEGCYRTSDWINAAPTVDAIPVEWLEEQRDKLSEAWDEEWHEINGLIEQWQEEQEAR